MRVKRLSSHLHGVLWRFAMNGCSPHLPFGFLPVITATWTGLSWYGHDMGLAHLQEVVRENISNGGSRETSSGMAGLSSYKGCSAWYLHWCGAHSPGSPHASPCVRCFSPFHKWASLPHLCCCYFNCTVKSTWPFQQRNWQETVLSLELGKRLRFPGITRFPTCISVPGAHIS